jgi:hypothetical protein
MKILKSPFENSNLINDYAMLDATRGSSRVLSYLTIESDQTNIVTKNPDGEVMILSLDIGSDVTGSAYFHHEPPTPAEVESAINLIEDELMRAVPALPERTALYSKESFIRIVAVNAGISDDNEIVLSRQEIENVFTKFADLSMGSHASTDIPVDSWFAAQFLILREIMHHLKFDRITVL